MSAPNFPAPGSQGMVTPFQGNGITSLGGVGSGHTHGFPSLGPNPATPARIIKASEYQKNRLQWVKIVDTPDMPYIAYRSWFVNTGIDVHTLRLASIGIGKGIEWKVGINYANCFQGRQHRDITEISLCECGFYGLLRKDKMTSWGAGSTIPGVFLATGDVVLHGNEGLRAQKAQVLCLAIDVPQELWKSTFLDNSMLEQIYEALAEHYQIPLVPYDKLEQYAREFGMEVPLEN
jgi:hypothetical protein